MNITNLSRLIAGEMIVKPNVTSIDSFAFDLKDVKNACVFFAINSTKEDVEIAIQKGAYCIIFENDLQFYNNETAFIKVKNINDVLLKLFIYFSELKEHKFIKLSEIQYDMLANYFSFDKKKHLFSYDLKEDFLKIYDSQEKTIFFINDNLYNLNLEFEYFLPKIEFKTEEKSSIFFSTFIFKEQFFNNLSFPNIFIKDFCFLYLSLENIKVEFKVSDYKNFNHFMPIFVDKNFNICSFGDSYRAFIVESNENIFKKEAEFLRKIIKSDVLICAPENFSLEFKVDFYYEDLSKLKNIENFRYCLVLGDFKSLSEILTIKKENYSLF